jgi:hypothetical protein
MGIDVGTAALAGLISRPGRETLGQRGATAVEYALMMTLIAVAIIGAVTLFGGAVRDLFDVDFPG